MTRPLDVQFVLDEGMLATEVEDKELPGVVVEDQSAGSPDLRQLGLAQELALGAEDTEPVVPRVGHHHVPQGVHPQTCRVGETAGTRAGLAKSLGGEKGVIVDAKGTPGFIRSSFKNGVFHV